MLAARLYLHSFYWLSPNTAAQRKSGILKAYATASMLITDSLSTHASVGLLTYGTIVFPRMLFAAAYTIFKVINSRLSLFIDCEHGATLYHSVIAALHCWDMPEDDSSKFASNVLAYLWRSRDENPAEKYEDPTLLVKTRFGASIHLDALRRWADQRRRALEGVEAGQNVPGNRKIHIALHSPPTDNNSATSQWQRQSNFRSGQ